MNERRRLGKTHLSYGLANRFFGIPYYSKRPVMDTLVKIDQVKYKLTY